MVDLRELKSYEDMKKDLWINIWRHYYFEDIKISELSEILKSTHSMIYSNFKKYDLEIKQIFTINNNRNIYK